MNLTLFVCPSVHLSAGCQPYMSVHPPIPPSSHHYQYYHSSSPQLIRLAQNPSTPSPKKWRRKMVLQSTGVKNISGIHCWEGAKGSLSLFLSLQSLSLSLSHSLTPPPWLNEMSSTSAALTALPSNPMQWLITDIPEGKQAKGGNDQREEGKQTLEH